VKYLKEASTGKTLFMKNKDKFKPNAVYTIEQPKGNILSEVSFFYFDIIKRIVGTYSTLLHLPHLRFSCVRGCWDGTQDFFEFSIGKSDALTTELDLNLRNFWY
jgi:hypothetical protein